MIARAGEIAHAPPAPRAARAARAPCAHCGEICPRGAPALESGERFCCEGCRSVWSLLGECGLAEYYRLRALEGATGARPREPAHGRRAYDAPQFLERHALTAPDGRQRVELAIEGLRCGACLWLIESLPRLVFGVLVARVDPGRSTILLEWDPATCRLSEIARFVERLGYAVMPLRDRGERVESRRAERAWVARVGTAGVLAANTMGIAFALYGGLFHAMDPRVRAFLQWTALALAALSVLVPGRIFLRQALVALRTRVPHMDLPISLALVAALAGGAWSTARGGGGVYAESLSMLVFLLLAGRFVQFRSQRRAREQVELIAALLPSSARRRCADGAIEEIPLEAVERGDRVVVPVGDVAPADGLVLDAGAWVDLQALTGESRPVELAPGDRCWAGARALGRPIELSVEAAGASSRMGRIRALVDEASSRRAPIVDFANRIAGWFLGAVLILAAGTFALWFPVDPAAALEHTVALLVVTCPCVLGLATPLAIVASISKAARAGSLIKGGDVLERLGACGVVVFDKTGTLTEGTMRIERIDGDAAAVALAAHVETHSAHPLRHAFAEWAGLGADGGAGVRVRAVTETPGQGIRAEIDGSSVAVGRLAFAGGVADAAWRNRERAMADAGLTPIAISVDGSVRALVGIGDPIRAEARATIERLRARGWRIAIASGDDPAIVARVAGALGVAPSVAIGRRTPEEKLEWIETLRRSSREPIVMVGDGVNDVAAMAAADVGVAIGGGTRASLEVGDVCLTRGGLNALPALLEGARRTHRVIRANFILSVGYNVIGAALAIAGLMNPLIAAALMPLSSLTATAVALRATRFDRSIH